MKFVTVLKYLMPVLKLLWTLLKPTIRKLLESLWQGVEDYVESHLKDMEGKVKGVEKARLFDKQAVKIFSDNNRDVTIGDLNLVREVIHKKMSAKQKKKG